MLAIGMHVEIQRSDGRIHGAVIAEIKNNGRYMVEWYEKGETKGKESTYEELAKLNPTLKQGLPEPVKLQPRVASQRQQPQHPPQTQRPSQAHEFHNFMNSHRNVQDDDDTFLLDAMMEDREKPQPPVTRRERIDPPAATRPANSRRSMAPDNGNSLPQPPPPMAQKTAKVAPQAQYRAPSPVTKKEPPAPVAPAPTPAPQQVQPVARAPSPTPMSYPQQDVSAGNVNYAFAEMIRAYRNQIDYRPLTINDPVSENRISVCVRKRPLNKKEIAKGEIEVVTIPSRDIIVLHQPQVRVDLTKYLENQKFRFDYAFDENSSNDLVYKFTAQPLVKTIFEKGTATCFAYGQTGSGKTHTMGGDFSGKKQNASLGIYALTARDVFRMLEMPQYRRKDLSVHCAFFEIYGSKVFDLLNDKAMLRVLEDNKNKVQVVGLKEELTTNEQEVLDLINKGSLVRTAGTTSANANSSRSHAVFQIILRQGKSVWGKFSLIDLAGNERGHDTRECDRETRQEGAAINTSLLALKECIRAMARNSSHVPFRQSKLTLVLRDSFIGENARTVMISMISPGVSSSEHSLNTLRYADRVKEMGTEGSGDATPIRDEEIFLPPQIEKSDDEDDEAYEAHERSEKLRGVTAQVRQSREIFDELIAALSRGNATDSRQKREVLTKFDELAKSMNRAKSAFENI
ncbi:unnamed protein product [Caenorhabditis bovis]|uniref:Kinesin-like protein n=1 Tax=Caenorhabditis bovis TaxID=2654633 RepID=A0A8S1ENS0_9PELO|nr:unnamed protein product [Caenorhabditis bovis]